MAELTVPFFRPDIGDDEIDAVSEVLRSGWLTSGPVAERFEREFASAVGARHAVAVNSCTAALHIAVGALGLRSGQAVLVPSLTFAATAAVVRHQGAVPIFVDCDPQTLQLDFDDARRKVRGLHVPRAVAATPVVGMIPVHVGGAMIDTDAARRFAHDHGLWMVEDAAHAFPAAWRRGPGEPWQRCGEQTADVTCFSFYANKTITTGEGGMAVTHRDDLAGYMRTLSLHGLSAEAFERHKGHGAWKYRVIAPGYSYNLADTAAAIGVRQLAKADAMRQRRESVADRYVAALAGIEQIALPPRKADRIHAWHLFPVQLRLDRLDITRDRFIDELQTAGVTCSVHWRPLHLHQYYQQTYGWRAHHCPAAAATWRRLVSLPIFPAMTDRQVEQVVSAVRDVCAAHAILRPAA